MSTVSLVVATLNAGAFIERCLRSCLSQSYRNKEIFVVDGGSIDETLDIVRKYVGQVKLISCDNDMGIYDAWNISLSYLSSDWVLFLGADDVWLSDDALKGFMEYVGQRSYNYVSAQVLLGSDSGPLLGKRFSGSFILFDMMVAHVGSLHKRELFYDLSYDADYKIIGDYEFLRRNRKRISAGYYPNPIIIMGSDGVSRTQKRNLALEVRKMCMHSWYDIMLVYPVFLFRFMVSDIKSGLSASDKSFYFNW